MNKFHTLIKSAMLTYPLLYPTKFKFVSSLFTNVWKTYEFKDGELHFEECDQFKIEMDYSDIDERLAKEKEDSYFIDHLIQAKKERQDREFTEKNIDLIVQSNCFTTDSEIQLFILKTISKNWDWHLFERGWFINQLPSDPNDVHEDFRVGIREFAHNVLYGMNCLYGSMNQKTYKECFDHLDKDGRPYKFWLAFVKAADYMTEEERANEAIKNKVIEQLIQDIFAEEKL